MTKEENRLVYRKEIWEKKLKHGKMVLSTLLKMEMKEQISIGIKFSFSCHDN